MFETKALPRECKRQKAGDGNYFEKLNFRNSEMESTLKSLDFQSGDKSPLSTASGGSHPHDEFQLPLVCAPRGEAWSTAETGSTGPLGLGGFAQRPINRHAFADVGNQFAGDVLQRRLAGNFHGAFALSLRNRNGECSRLGCGSVRPRAEPECANRVYEAVLSFAFTPEARELQCVWNFKLCASSSATWSLWWPRGKSSRRLLAGRTGPPN